MSTIRCSDGHGIPGGEGDLIQIDWERERARVVRIDLATGTLTLYRPLACRRGQGVALASEERAPDPGAFEAALAQPGGARTR